MGCTVWIVYIISKVFKIVWTIVRGYFHFLYFFTLPVVLSTVAVLNFVTYVQPHEHFDTTEAWAFLKAFIQCLTLNLPPAIGTYIVSTRCVNTQFSKWKHFMMLSLFVVLIYCPFYLLFVFSYLEATTDVVLNDFTRRSTLIFLVVIQMSYQICVFGPRYVVLKDVWPHLFDICDGLMMVAQMERDNPPWTNVLICVAVVPFFFAVYFRLHLVIFPQFQTIVNRLVYDVADFVFLLFLAIRVVLLLKLRSVSDIVFTARMLHRCYYEILPKIINPAQPEEEDFARETAVNVDM